MYCFTGMNTYGTPSCRYLYIGITPGDILYRLRCYKQDICCKLFMINYNRLQLSQKK